MSRNQLRLAAVVLVVLMAMVAGRALDHLPANLRGQIDAERTAFSAAQSQLDGIRTQVAGQVQAQPDLFAALPFGREWQGQFSQASTELGSASSDVDRLTRLEKSNHRSNRQEVETLLAHLRKSRTQALADASGIQSAAAHWVDAGSHLPQQIPAMERNYRAIHDFDLGPVTTAVERAGTDWPQKKSDLDARLAAERSIVTQTDAQWQANADLRSQAASGTLTGAGAGSLLALEDSLQTSAAELPQKAAQLQTLSGQLYTSWDQLLVDMQTRGDGNAKAYEQKIRTVRTHLADATAKSGEVTSDEQWTPVPHSTYDGMRNDLGMAIAHKPAGEYDFEAQHVAQPAGMAYVAPPSQGSNQYGYWQHRDGGDFWVFYGQYALLRDLLFNRDYRPFDRREWEDYRNYSNRGQTYYGHDSSSDAPKYGSQGTTTQQRYSSSTYAHSGGFRDSPYAAKSGNYRSSQYSSPSARDPNADHSPKTFGHSAPSEPRAPPARTFHPAPSRPPARMPGRSFGRHR
jgi:hypothetical protein